MLSILGCWDRDITATKTIQFAVQMCWSFIYNSVIHLKFHFFSTKDLWSRQQQVSLKRFSQSKAIALYGPAFILSIRLSDFLAPSGDFLSPSTLLYLTGIVGSPELTSLGLLSDIDYRRAMSGLWWGCDMIVNVFQSLITPHCTQWDGPLHLGLILAPLHNGT